jgi:hypothetical protein
MQVWLTITRDGTGDLQPNYRQDRATLSCTCCGIPPLGVLCCCGNIRDMGEVLAANCNCFAPVLPPPPTC